MNTRYLIARKIEVTKKLLEGVMAEWVSFRRVHGPEETVIYPLFHQIYETETWDCGVIQLRKPWKV